MCVRFITARPRAGRSARGVGFFISKYAGSFPAAAVTILIDAVPLAFCVYSGFWPTLGCSTLWAAALRRPAPSTLRTPRTNMVLNIHHVVLPVHWKTKFSW